MDFGFPPRRVYTLDASDYTQEQAWALVLDSALSLGWHIQYVSKSGIIAHTKTGWNSWADEITVRVHNNKVIITCRWINGWPFDWSNNKKTLSAFLSKFEEVKSALSPWELETKLADYKQTYPSSDNDVLENATPTNGWAELISIFKPTEGYYVAPILLNVNIVLFIIMSLSGVHLFSPDNQDLINWDANFKPITLEGEWWRLFTCMFIHIGIFHLLLNAYALFYIGILLEPYLGKSRFLYAYFFCGLVSSLTSLWWNDFTISAGASGAIFGMYGVFIALLTTRLFEKSVKRSFLTSIGIFVGYNLLYGLAPDSQIDNAAHIGGLLSGVVAGYAFLPSLVWTKTASFKHFTGTALMAVVLVASYWVYFHAPNTFATYQKAMERFHLLEAEALQVFQLNDSSVTTKEQILHHINNKGINYWKENIKILDTLDQLNLPTTLVKQNRLLREYCELRIKTYQLLDKKVEEDTDVYNDSIIFYNSQIKDLLNASAVEKED